MGHTCLEKILLNINFILGQIGTEQKVKLVELRPGEVVGDWRDSGAGLAYGRYPFSVNGALVPVALAAIKVILGSTPPGCIQRKLLKGLI